MDWAREIRDLHEFFEAWFLGTADSMQPMLDALVDDFTIVSPSGDVSDRVATIAAVESARAHTSSLRIRIRGDELLAATDELVVARYIESHDLVDRSNDRRSTVVFRVDPRRPNGLRWLTVHETWLAS